MADPTPPIAALPTVAGIENDPEVYAAVKNLALRTVDAALEILDTAAPLQQQSMIRILLPKFAGGLSKRAGDDNAELRSKVMAMYSEVAAALEDPDEHPADDGIDSDAG